MMNGEMHISVPDVLSSSYRILPKHARKFFGVKFHSFSAAMTYGLDQYKTGFRIFHQKVYEWYDPSNTLLAKIENTEKCN